ncbi:MAG: tripartite tricarboxylate transporter TctB family protein [Synergistaceae bacterium]|nr:tripartite tricarboxylate transporter TctB family protein [Synergistaceae bacterium]
MDAKKEHQAGNNGAEGSKGPCRKRGELGLTVILFLFGALGYYFAMGMTSETYSSPSVFPKLISFLIMLFSAVIFYQARKRPGPDENEPPLLAFLFPKDVFVLITLLVVYAVVLPYLHFIAASYLFLVIGIIYLQRGKNKLRAFIISAAALAILVVIFRYIFMVILP